MSISHTPVVQYQNKEIDLGTIHRAYSDFTMNLFVCMTVCAQIDHSAEISTLCLLAGSSSLSLLLIQFLRDFKAIIMVLARLTELVEIKIRRSI